MNEPESNSPSESPLPGPDELKHYYELMKEKDLAELEIKEKGFYLKLSRQGFAPVAAPVFHTPAHPVAPATPAAKEPEKTPAHLVVSPLAGVFYRSPAPQSPPFVKEGDAVAFGDVLCIVEAMKVMNEIRADRPGKIRKIVAENNKPVAAGQGLFQLDPS